MVTTLLHELQSSSSDLKLQEKKKQWKLKSKIVSGV